MNENMNKSVVWRTQIYYQINSSKLFKEIADPCNIFLHSPLGEFAIFIFFSSIILSTYLVPYLFRIDFFMSLWIASPIRCFSTSAPHSTPPSQRLEYLFYFLFLFIDWERERHWFIVVPLIFAFIDRILCVPWLWTHTCLANTHILSTFHGNTRFCTRDTMASDTAVSPASIQVSLERMYISSSSVLLLPKKH